jgi:uracil-DNA glycosylase
VAVAQATLSAQLAATAWGRALLPRVPAGTLASLDSFLAQERAAGHEVLPPPQDILRVYRELAPEDVRVVIVGQDPYPTPGDAHGLAFSYVGSGRRPASLRNILLEVAAEDLGATDSGRSDLGAWARQGVLLLNTVLTVRAGEAGAHRRRGWELLTRATLELLAARPDRIVFLLWGRHAQKLGAGIAEPHLVLSAGHPSPLSVRYFRGCGHFRAVNEALPASPIDWSV